MERSGSQDPPGFERSAASSPLPPAGASLDAVSRLPGLLASVLQGNPGAGEPAELAAALRWAIAPVSTPAARMAARLADRLAGGDDLAHALHHLGDGDEGARWAATAVEVHRELGGDLPALLGVADRAVAERAVVAGERASLRIEARLIVGALVAQPVLLAGVGALMTDGVGPLDLALLVVAVLLTVLGGWWLTRIARPPHDWRPWRRDHRVEVPADGLLDRAALAGCAGVALEDAVRWAAGGRPGDDTARSTAGAWPEDEMQRTIEGLRARAGRPAGAVASAQAPGGGGAAPAVGLLQHAATDVRRRQLAGTRADAGRLRWLAVIPYVACLLPASALVLVALV